MSIRCNDALTIALTLCVACATASCAIDSDSCASTTDSEETSLLQVQGMLQPGKKRQSEVQIWTARTAANEAVVAEPAMRQDREVQERTQASPSAPYETMDFGMPDPWSTGIKTPDFVLETESCLRDNCFDKCEPNAVEASRFPTNRLCRASWSCISWCGHQLVEAMATDYHGLTRDVMPDYLNRHRMPAMATDYGGCLDRCKVAARDAPITTKDETMSRDPGNLFTCASYVGPGTQQGLCW